MDEVKVVEQFANKKKDPVLITFLLGNGFDLNLGMKTEYKDVYDQYIKEETASEVIKKFKESLKNDKKHKYKNWSDFEIGMANYAKTLSSENELIECVRDFKTCMVKHLRKEEKKAQNFFNNEYNWKMLEEFNNSLWNFYVKLSPNVVNEISILTTPENKDYRYITFNYTKTLEFMLEKKPKSHNSPIHIHGDLENDVVMGVDNLEQLKGLNYSVTRRGQRNFVKTLFNEQYDKLRVEKAKQTILNSSVICVYGFSFGESDKFWTDLLAEWLSKNPHNHLVVYQYDTRIYNRYNYDEIMETEDYKKEALMTRLGINSAFFDQIHIPIGTNIFNLGKVKNKEISSVSINKEQGVLV